MQGETCTRQRFLFRLKSLLDFRKKHGGNGLLERFRFDLGVEPSSQSPELPELRWVPKDAVVKEEEE